MIMNKDYSKLSKGKIKVLKKALRDDYGFTPPEEWVFLERGKNKIWLTNKKVVNHILKDSRIEGMGIYFGYLDNHNIRLRVESSQLIGPHASKNLLEISEEQARMYIRGYNLEINNNLDKIYVILHYKNGFIGVGKNNGEKIFCHIPKKRRIHKL